MKPPQAFVFRSGDGNLFRENFEEALAGAAFRGFSALTLAPNAHWLAPDHPAAERIRRCEGPAVAAAWLFPRATQWILHALGLPEDRPVACVDLRLYCCPSAAAEEMARLAERLLGAPREPQLLPRRENFEEPVARRWHPVLDYSRCKHCGQCLEYCLFHVYAKDARGRVQVAAPDNCKPGCPACARLCPEGAILFPECDTDEAIAGAPGKAAAPGADRERQEWAQRAGLPIPSAAACACDPPPKSAPERDELDDLIAALEEQEERA